MFRLEFESEVVTLVLARFRISAFKYFFCTFSRLVVVDAIQNIPGSSLYFLKLACSTDLELFFGLNSVCYINVPR